MRSSDNWREQFRRAMLERRTALRRTLQNSIRPSAKGTRSAGGVADVMDQASDDAAESLAAGLAEIESGQLVQIDEALRRLEDGTYGQCLDCSKTIPKARLQMVPFAIRCVQCQQTRDRTHSWRP